MSDSVNILKDSLSNLGLSPEEALVLSLLFIGLNKPLDISRKSNLSRAKVYRILEKLQSKELLITMPQEYGQSYSPPSLKRIEQLLVQEKEKLAQKETILKHFKEDLAEIQQDLTPKSKVLHYSGIEGYKQVNWNSTKATDGICIYEFETLNIITDQDFAEDLRLELVKNKVFVNQISNLDHLDDYTNITDHPTKFLAMRYIPKEIVEITSETLIYNDVFVTYEKKDDDIMIVEIYNQKLADMQRQIFAQIWEIAQPMKVFPNGGAVLESTSVEESTDKDDQ